jgi:protocatechuate 3,4-dioxygenase beta subunit
MKNYSRPLLLFSVLLLFGPGASGATISIIPSATSNTYSGVITLNITGLTNGEPVEIQKYLDLNGNGIVDAGEPLVDAFKITDGGATLIGGITNLNVPFDSNPAVGAITTTHNFIPALIVDTFVASYIYRVVSPGGRFTPVPATFLVTNAVSAQYLSGTVYSNGVPFPNAVVVAQDQQDNNPAAGTVTDSAGNYFLPLRPGSYSLIAIMPNFYFDQSMAPSVNLTNGTSATNNLFLTNGTVTISGNVYDAATSNKIDAAFLQLESANLFAIAFTDANGNYSAAVTPGFWKIQPVKERFARRGYVVSQDKLQIDTTTGNVANVGIAVFPGNALFYGRVTDNSNTPLANVEIDCGTQNSFSSKGYSDANGNYAAAVLGDVTNQWNAGVNDGKDLLLGDYIFNSFPSTNVFPNQTILQNFVALPATARISGYVHDSSGNPVSGVTLFGNATINGKNYQALDSTTDNSGTYSLAVASGFWDVEFLNGGFEDNLDTHGYVDLSMPHFVSIPPTNVVLNLIVYPIGTPAISGARRFSSTQFGFNVTGATNVNYTVQTSTSLASTNWNNLFSFLLTTNPFPIVDPYATNSPRFYRVKKN